MALPDIFSRRKRLAQGEHSDVYSYDELPQKVRVQIIHILRDAIGPYTAYSDPPGKSVYNYIVRVMRKELGVFFLGNYQNEDADEELLAWFQAETEIDRMIDFLELSMRLIDMHVRSEKYAFEGVVRTSPDDAISEINARLLEGAIGYSYQSGQIIRVDSQVAHAEIVVPALQLLSAPEFATANKEYLAAHSAFRAGDHETAIVECAKAYESTLKIIGTKRGWPITSNDPAKKLLDAAYAAGFIEPALQAEFSALRAVLESGVPTVRNKQGGHGAGSTPRNVPQELAAFQLHQTAAAIIFLVEHDRAAR